MQEDKTFNSGNTELIVRTYHNETPELVIRYEEYSLYFEFESKEQLKEIITYLQEVLERWD